MNTSVESTATPPGEARSEQGEGELKRVMGPGLLLLFIVGDILGAGIYAVTGDIAGEVGGMAWLPFLTAFAVATMTAFSYLELVTKHPHAAGAALFTEKAFGVHFLTFIVAFLVMCSGITSAATSSNLVAANLLTGLGLAGEDGPSRMTTMFVAFGFMILLALINLRGVSESVKFNVVLTIIELVTLGLVIGIGFYVMATKGADVSQLTVFDSGSDKSAFAAVTVATAIAFFAMVGFEDSVNMVEETRNPSKVFPRTMLTGLGIAVIIYMLVAISVILVIPVGEIQKFDGETGILLEVVKQGIPGFPVHAVFPFMTIFAVANTALINMLMASRLVYGMAKQNVLPSQLGTVSYRQPPSRAVVFTTVLALGLIAYVALQKGQPVVSALGGTTGLLLLLVFTVVNVACLVLRREKAPLDAFRAPTILPVLGAFGSAFLAGPWARDPEKFIQYRIGGILLLIGVALWALTYIFHKRRHEPTWVSSSDMDELDS